MKQQLQNAVDQIGPKIGPKVTATAAALTTASAQVSEKLAVSPIGTSVFDILEQALGSGNLMTLLPAPLAGLIAYVARGSKPVPRVTVSPVQRAAGDHEQLEAVVMRMDEIQEQLDMADTRSYNFSKMHEQLDMMDQDKADRATQDRHKEISDERWSRTLAADKRILSEIAMTTERTMVLENKLKALVLGWQPAEDLDDTVIEIEPDYGYFTKDEFDCKCDDEAGCDYQGMDPETLEVLNDLRHNHGPIIVNSGYRCPRHNKNVGGASGSKHMESIAADVRSPRIAPEILYAYLDNKYPGKYGLGLYNSFVHVDTRSENPVRKKTPTSQWKSI